ncbi:MULTISPECIES: hypothetical protein [Peptoniphilus]|uniref:hypothetical protein n=1 Tax=Peptoniphilus TaxID=162289 RepID=UPI0001DAA169|nr:MULTISPECIES: hypothetical protein [Peptoniphilus]EFI41698.1 hypothetical protein HMPREF0629_00322 [Peptoniphilus sp. oral taxon 386 str. F0131]
MERERLIKIVEELKLRLGIKLGVNPDTKEEGIKIEAVPSTYDIEFIENNREQIIDILKNEYGEIEITVKLEKNDYKKLSEEAKKNILTVEDYVKKIIFDKIR